jgi:hypothetical protein
VDADLLVLLLLLVVVLLLLEHERVYALLLLLLLLLRLLLTHWSGVRLCGGLSTSPLSSATDSLSAMSGPHCFNIFRVAFLAPTAQDTTGGGLLRIHLSKEIMLPMFGSRPMNGSSHSIMMSMSELENRQ